MDTIHHTIHRLCVEKLKQMGIPSGPLYGKLKRGEEIVTPSGITVCAIISHRWWDKEWIDRFLMHPLSQHRLHTVALYGSSPWTHREKKCCIININIIINSIKKLAICVSLQCKPDFMVWFWGEILPTMNDDCMLDLFLALLGWVQYFFETLQIQKIGPQPTKAKKDQPGLIGVILII